MVAEEVRKLADCSALAAKEIEQIIAGSPILTKTLYGTATKKLDRTASMLRTQCRSRIRIASRRPALLQAPDHASMFAGGRP